MGESVEEAVITKWLKKVGDQVEIDEPIVEIATDKVDSDLPSEVSGVLAEIKYQEESVVSVGDILAVIHTEQETAVKSTIKKKKPLIEPKTKQSKSKTVEIETQKELDKQFEQAQSLVDEPRDSLRYYSPLVKSIAKKENITGKELGSILGTGKGGRVTKNDVFNYLKNRPLQSSFKTSSSINGQSDESKKEIHPSQTSVNTYSPDKNQLIELSRMQRLTAQHMRESLDNSAHVYSFVEADVTDLWAWREEKKEYFLKEFNQKLTFTPLLVHAIVKALKDYPVLNSTKENDKIKMWSSVNLGMATALPNGNLIVPVIKDAGNLHFVDLVSAVNKLANKARTNTLAPDDVKNGTYTMTNIGNFGTLMGTPIIHQPQISILAVGTIRKIPSVIESPQGDSIGIRKKVILSHSYDHQIINGATGSLFAKKVADYLENWKLVL